MRLRNRLGVSALAISLVATPIVLAQVSARPLAQVEAWGVGWIGANEGALPATFWDRAGAETLAPLMAALHPKDLSPAARAALRRILLSRSKGPADGDKLTPERLRLIEAIGETGHAIDLRRRYPATEWGKSGERQAAEFDLLAGNADTACTTATGKPANDTAWMPLRAVCAAFSKEAGASLIVEQVARSDESLGVWLVAALPAINSIEISKPEGRFATPLEAAVSVAAKLPVPANAFATTTPDAIAAIARNKAAIPEQRRAALRPALAADRLTPAEAVEILSLKSSEAPKPQARGAAPKPDYLLLAVASAADKDAKPETKAAAIATALRASETLADGRLAAIALGETIASLPRNETTLAYAEPFARAALLAGNIKLATDWRRHLGSVATEKQDAWAAARLDFMLVLAGASSEAPSDILDRMLEAAPYASPGSAPARPGAADQQLSLRRIETTRALFMAVGTGRDLTAAQRATLAAQRSAGRGVSDAVIARIASAARQDADAEAALAILGQLGPDVSALSFAGLADLLTQLREIGMIADADAIALEAMQVWKAL